MEMDIPLTINDIREWLITNAPKYHEQKSLEFPPQEEGVFFGIDKFYTTYGRLFDFMRYYRYKSKCDIAVTDLMLRDFDDVEKLAEWAKKYRILGSHSLILFDIDYLWDKHLEKVLIEKDLYADKEPFLNMICFIRVFQHLYWDYALHEEDISGKDIRVIKAELIKIINHNYKPV